MTSTTDPLPKNNTQIIFKCDKHAGIIFEKLQNFYAENEFFDTVLIVGKENNDRVSIPAHRFVLGALSEYFLEIFRDAHTAVMKNVLEFQQIDAATLKLIIDFMYSGWIELSVENVENILRVASFLKMKMLVDGCLEFIEQNINSTNSLSWIRVSTELNLSRLKSKSLECTYNHFEEISKQEGLLMLNENELKDLLFNDNPHGDFEEEVFLTLMAWINYDITIRENLTLDLLSMVRFQCLSPKFIAENISLCNSVKSFELMSSWLKWHLSPGTRSDCQKVCTFKPRNIPEKLANIQISDSSEIVIQIYNQKENAWSIKKPALFSKNDKKTFSTIVIDNKLIVVGGAVHDFLATNSIECLDLHSFEWTDCTPMNKKRFMCQLADLNGNLCIFGGLNRGMIVHSIELYDFSTRQMKDVKPPPYLPTQTSKIAACNGVLYVLDICNGSLQSYDVSSQEWTLKKIETFSLCHFGFAAVKGFLYVIGGRFKTTVKCYNLFDDCWFDVAPLSQVYSDIKTTIFENKILICSKTTDNKVVVEEFDPETETWTRLHSLSMDDGSYYSSVMFSLRPKFS